jgi:hypothetical protein
VCVRDACVEDRGSLDGWSCAVCGGSGKLGINKDILLHSFSLFCIIVLNGGETSLFKHLSTWGTCPCSIWILVDVLGPARWQDKTLPSRPHVMGARSTARFTAGKSLSVFSKVLPRYLNSDTVLIGRPLTVNTVSFTSLVLSSCHFRSRSFLANSIQDAVC